jgi:hypothetical protein
VAKLYLPDPYDFDAFFRGMEDFNYLADHHKYANNYLYHRSVYLMNRQEHLDNGFLLLKPEKAISSPVGTLYFEPYRHEHELVAEIAGKAEQVQCIAGREVKGLTTVPFGKTQHPGPWDYADNVDTLDFLSNL